MDTPNLTSMHGEDISWQYFNLIRAWNDGWIKIRRAPHCAADSGIGWIVESVGSLDTHNAVDSSFNHAAYWWDGGGLLVCTPIFVLLRQRVIRDDVSFIDFVAPVSTQLLSPGEVGIPFL
jgi:hypothetical protein